MITYEPLRILLVKRSIKKMDFIAKVGISPTTAAKLWNDGYVSLEVLDRICEAYDVEISDVVRRKKEQEG
ncbi:helix-turn-helix transcriptional regulator [Paenibacillus sp. HN-1]|uniref:helix-turn-helix domain-containing protein n=1 Tax=Paenibacillus TaxID=44249 RepID=UPI001CA9088A|nr:MULTISPECIES: helix-turn-helix transcriptional regulator [Paenibacillus]MBY9080967.1 helix-turn-helix transcriptional regulator [Paenibacillus sp. CGMCC 1.18879]MBY9083179.1 helix-turn-helix transcriptional regulator [Paenibacillus sinensis]